MPTPEEKNVFLKNLEQEKALEQKTGSENTPNTKKKTMSATALFATLFLLFLLVITLLIFVISIGGARNPILQSFGIESGEVKEFLLGLNNWTFGTLTVILLLLFSVGLFRGVAARKEEKEKRRNSLLFAFVSGGLIFAVVLAWFAIFAFIKNLPATAIDAKNRIEITNFAPDARVVAPVTIDFSAKNIEQELKRAKKKILEFRWDKDGDGNYEIPGGFNPEVSILFREQGRQVVGLLIELENEEPQKFTIEFTIDSVAFDAFPEKGEAPLNVQFDASEVTESLAVKTFEWDFDADGTYEENSSSSKITHTFPQIGVFPVRLRVILQDDQVKSFERAISVTGALNEKLRAVIDATPLQGPAPLIVQFSGQKSFSAEGDIVHYVWDFVNQDLKIREQKITHEFTVPGTYSVELSVENEAGLVAKNTVEIVVEKPVKAPQIFIKSTPPLNEKKQIVSEASPLNISFDATGTTDPDNNITTFSWDFTGDSLADATGAEVSYSFYTAGTIPVTLIVTDAEGNVSRETITVITKTNAVQAVITANPETGSVPLTINFDGSQSYCGENCRILSFEWDFKDGTPAQLTGAQTAHTFTKVGTFPVGLKITTEDGKTHSITKTVAVRVPVLKACFTPSRVSGKAPLAVTFKDCSSGTVQNWKWDFGDGAVSHERAPEHTFTAPGTYTVRLLITDENNTSSQSEEEISVQ